MDLKTFLFRKETFSYAATGRGCLGTAALSLPVLHVQRSGSTFLDVLEAHVMDSVQIKLKLNYLTVDSCCPWGTAGNIKQYLMSKVKSVFNGLLMGCKKGHFYKKANFISPQLVSQELLSLVPLHLWPYLCPLISTFHNSLSLLLGFFVLFFLLACISVIGSSGHFQGPPELMEPTGDGLKVDID